MNKLKQEPKGKLRLATARRIARGRLPYFSQLLESLAPLPTPGFGTFAVTEHLVLIYDPEVLDAWALPKLAYVYAHEGMHVFHKHVPRGIRMGVYKNGPDALFWGISVDTTINRILHQVWQNWSPDDAILPNRMWQYIDPLEPDPAKALKWYKLPVHLHNATAEEIYLFLKNNKANIPQPPPNTNPGVLHGQCGSGSGHASPGEVGPEHEASRSGSQIEAIIRQTASAIAAQARKDAGSIPGSLLLDASAVLEPPRVPWQKQLQHHMHRSLRRKTGAVDYGYHGLSRRQGALIVALGQHVAPILPKLYAPELIVEIATDVSGSMLGGELGIAMRETGGLLRALGAKTLFTAIDSAIQVQKKVGNVREVVRDLRGGGGTDFRPYFSDLDKRMPKDRPHLAILMTDGHGPAPSRPPKGIDVIVLLIGAGAIVPYSSERGEPIKWAKIVRVEA